MVLAKSQREFLIKLVTRHTDSFRSCYVSLSDKDRCQSLKILGDIACAAAGTLVTTSDLKQGTIVRRCDVCDQLIPAKNCPSTEVDLDISSEAIKTLTSLIGLPVFEQSRRPRILAMLSLRRFVKHFNDETFLNLETSILGQFCLKSLRSSLRELRIAAGRTLPSFLSNQTSASTILKNRRNVLELLRELSIQSPLHLIETCILAWGQIGRVSRDQELNLILLRLVEYLGHTNQIVSGVAFNEILMLAEALGMSVSQMFAPYWRNIAPTAIKDLQNRPQTTQLMADLLSMSVAQLLIKSQSYTVPWLILTKKHDVILRISQARQDEAPWMTCMDNLAPTLALLLIQNVPDIESLVMDLMRLASSYFNNLHLTDLLKIGPIDTALELLKNAGEEDVSKRPRVSHTFLPIDYS